MKNPFFRSWFWAFIALQIGLGGAMFAAPAATLADIAQLNDKAVALQQAGQYDKAAVLAQQALDLARRFLGAENPNTASLINNLAELYRIQGKYAAAEPLYRDALRVWEKTAGPESAEVSTALNNIGLLYKAMGRYREAKPMFKRALAIDEKTAGPNDMSTAKVLSNLGELYREQGRYAEAEPLYLRSIQIREKAAGPESSATATAINNLALLKTARGEFEEAEALYKRVLAIWEKTLGPDHPYVGTVLNNLAEAFRNQGRYGEAEPLYKRSLVIRRASLGDKHPHVADTANNLALVYDALNRPAEAEQLFRQALAIRRAALGGGHPDVAAMLNNLAEFYLDHGRGAEAEALYKEALAIWTKTLGPDHPNVATAFNNLGRLHLLKRQYGQAESNLKQALAIRLKVLTKDHPETSGALNNLAWVAFEQGEWEKAAGLWRQSTSLIVSRVKLGGSAIQRASGPRKDAERSSFQFYALVKAAYRQAESDPSKKAGLAREIFEIVQWAHASEAAAAIVHMTARTAAGSGALAALVRERQDLAAERAARDALLLEAQSQSPQERDRQAESVLADRLAAVENRLAVIDRTLSEKFPAYAEFAQPTPITAEQAQSLLRPDEALIFTVDSPASNSSGRETFVWTITNSEIRWTRSALGTEALDREVATLRCGLDYEGSWAGEGSRCAELLNAAYSEQDRSAGKPLPFSLERAHALYRALFGEVSDLLENKHLLVAPSGPLTKLPFHVLVAAPPPASFSGAEAMRHARWMVRDHAITTLPAVSSLKALREQARQGGASLPMVGFGNPLLDGASPGERSLAARARLNRACPVATASAAPSLRKTPAAMVRGLADARLLKSASPLPETAEELCAVGQFLNGRNEDIFLAERATETELKRLSTAGDLAKYRVVYFATHGALSGQVSAEAEPGLILTPPASVTAADDGYLSASEIAGLKLDADWVVLSACNTAAGAAGNAEALSGMAKAFFYAGTRAVLASHWPVDSAATIKLVTDAIGRLSRDASLRRAEALRLSMLALIDGGGAREAYPSIWAPFIIVDAGSPGK
jgi:CHAT domain-containing protein/tetratricopeptide (TPR) repeat protein